MSEIRISKQYGLPYLSVVVMEQNRLIEKHAKAMGLGDVKVTWATIGSGGTSTDSGVIKTRPESWKDPFFPSAHGLPGS